MSQVDTAHAWWSRLRHQGLLLSPVVMLERYPSAPEPATFCGDRQAPGRPDPVQRQGRRRGGTESRRRVDPRLGRCPARWLLGSQVGSDRTAERHPREAHCRRPHRQPFRDDPPAPGRLCRRQCHRARPAGHGGYVGSGRAGTGTHGVCPVPGASAGHGASTRAC